MADSHMMNVPLAMRYGIPEALFLTNICFWITRNKANNKHFHDGRYWTFNTMQAFCDLMPYFKPDQMRYLIKTLKEKKVILTGNYNRTGYDKTLWYSVCDEAMALYLNEPPKAVPDPKTSEQPKEDKKEEDTAAVPAAAPICPNGHIDAGNLPDGYDQTGTSMRKNSRIDTGDLPDRSGKSPEPIPVVNTVEKPVAAAEDTSSSSEGAAAVPLKIQELKECLKTLDMTLEMDTHFYPRAVSYMKTHALDSGYLAWLYEYCVKKKPESLRGLFYTLFFKADLRELYLGLKARADGLSADNSPAAEHLPRVRTEIVCPVCGTRYDDTVPYCPECDFRTHKHSDEQAIEKRRLVYAMSPETRAAYESEKDAAFREAMKQGMSPKAAMERIDRKYHIVIPEKIEGGIACLT